MEERGPAASPGPTASPVDRASSPGAEAAGLTDEEAARRLAEFGENALGEHHVSALGRLVEFFWGPIPWMIEIAAVLSAVVRHWDDFAIILAMLLVNAGVGFWQEFKADNAIALLKQRLALKARVLRDGQWQDIAARLLVPGDVVDDQARQHRPGRREAARGRLSQRRPVGADRRIAAGRQEGRRRRLFRLGRQAGRDDGGRHRHRHEDLFRQDRAGSSSRRKRSRISSARCCGSATS